MKNPKLVIGILAIVILLIILVVVFVNSKRTVVTKTGTTVTQAGFLDTLVDIFTPTTGTSTGTSGSGAKAFCKIFPKVCGEKKGYCNCRKPGLTIEGVTDPICNSESLQYEQDCL